MMRCHEFVHRCNEHIHTGNEHVCLSIVKKIYIAVFVGCFQHIHMCGYSGCNGPEKFISRNSEQQTINLNPIWKCAIIWHFHWPITDFYWPNLWPKTNKSYWSITKCRSELWKSIKPCLWLFICILFIDSIGVMMMLMTKGGVMWVGPFAEY